MPTRAQHRAAIRKRQAKKEAAAAARHKVNSVVSEEIQRLSEEKNVVMHAAFDRSMINMLNTMVNHKFTAKQFIYEYIQNARDAKATKLQIRLDGDKLLIINNGRQIDYKDLEKICDACNEELSAATKGQEEETIGYKDIGMKSLLSFACRLEIASGPHRSYFQKDDPKLKRNAANRVTIPWLFVPFYLTRKIRQIIPQQIDEKLTYFGFKIRAKGQDVAEQDAPLMKIREGLKKLMQAPDFVLPVGLEEFEISIVNQDGENDKKVTFTSEGNSKVDRARQGIATPSVLVKTETSSAPTHSSKSKSTEITSTKQDWLRFVAEIDIPDELKERLKGLPSTVVPPRFKAEKKKKTAVHLSIPINEGRIDAAHVGKVFATLPTSKTFGLPFDINADFILNTQRTNFLEDNVWNEHIFQHLNQHLFQMIQELLSKPEYRLQILALLPKTPDSVLLCERPKIAFKENFIATCTDIAWIPRLGGGEIALKEKCVDKETNVSSRKENTIYFDDLGFFQKFPVAAKQFHIVDPTLEHPERLRALTSEVKDFDLDVLIENIDKIAQAKVGAPSTAEILTFLAQCSGDMTDKQKIALRSKKFLLVDGIWMSPNEIYLMPTFKSEVPAVLSQNLKHLSRDGLTSDVIAFLTKTLEVKVHTQPEFIKKAVIENVNRELPAAAVMSITRFLATSLAHVTAENSPCIKERLPIVNAEGQVSAPKDSKYMYLHSSYQPAIDLCAEAGEKMPSRHVVSEDYLTSNNENRDALKALFLKLGVLAGLSYVQVQSAAQRDVLTGTIGTAFNLALPTSFRDNTQHRILPYIHLFMEYFPEQLEIFLRNRNKQGPSIPVFIAYVIKNYALFLNTDGSRMKLSDMYQAGVVPVDIMQGLPIIKSKLPQHLETYARTILEPSDALILLLHLNSMSIGPDSAQAEQAEATRVATNSVALKVMLNKYKAVLTALLKNESLSLQGEWQNIVLPAQDGNLYPLSRLRYMDNAEQEKGDAYSCVKFLFRPEGMEDADYVRLAQALGIYKASKKIVFEQEASQTASQAGILTRPHLAVLTYSIKHYSASDAKIYYEALTRKLSGIKLVQCKLPICLQEGDDESTKITVGKVYRDGNTIYYSNELTVSSKEILEQLADCMGIARTIFIPIAQRAPDNLHHYTSSSLEQLCSVLDMNTSLQPSKGSRSKLVDPGCLRFRLGSRAALLAILLAKSRMATNFSIFNTLNAVLANVSIKRGQAPGLYVDDILVGRRSTYSVSNSDDYTIYTSEYMPSTKEPVLKKLHDFLVTKNQMLRSEFSFLEESMMCSELVLYQKLADNLKALFELLKVLPNLLDNKAKTLELLSANNKYLLEFLFANPNFTTPEKTLNVLSSNLNSMVEFVLKHPDILDRARVIELLAVNHAKLLTLLLRKPDYLPNKRRIIKILEDDPSNLFKLVFKHKDFVTDAYCRRWIINILSGDCNKLVELLFANPDFAPDKRQVIEILGLENDLVNLLELVLKHPSFPGTDNNKNRVIEILARDHAKLLELLLKHRDFAPDKRQVIEILGLENDLVNLLELILKHPSFPGTDKNKERVIEILARDHAKLVELLLKHRDFAPDKARVVEILKDDQANLVKLLLEHPDFAPDKARVIELLKNDHTNLVKLLLRHPSFAPDKARIVEILQDDLSNLFTLVLRHPNFPPNPGRVVEILSSDYVKLLTLLRRHPNFIPPADVVRCLSVHQSDLFAFIFAHPTVITTDAAVGLQLQAEDDASYLVNNLAIAETQELQAEFQARLPLPMRWLKIPADLSPEKRVQLAKSLGVKFYVRETLDIVCSSASEESNIQGLSAALHGEAYEHLENYYLAKFKKKHPNVSVKTNHVDDCFYLTAQNEDGSDKLTIITQKPKEHGCHFLVIDSKNGIPRERRFWIKRSPGDEHKDKLSNAVLQIVQPAGERVDEQMVDSNKSKRQKGPTEIARKRYSFLFFPLPVDENTDTVLRVKSTGPTSEPANPFNGKILVSEGLSIALNLRKAESLRKKM